MKAGTALGLLAGLGAMNAMSGKAYGGKRFTGLMDMLDGGGAGASGDKFEGGGLLSMLGNLFMKPMQAQQNVERIASDTAATNAVTEVLKDAAKKQFDSKTVQDLAAANEDAYLQEAYGTPEVASLGDLVPSVVDESASGFDYVTGQEQGMGAPADTLSSAIGSPEEKPAGGLLSGNQIIPDMPSYNPSVPKLLETAQTRDFLSPIARGDYAEYSDYLRTGQYPRGAGEVPSNYLMPSEGVVELAPNETTTPIPAAPEPAGLGMSDAEQMIAIRSAIMRDPKMIGAFEEAFGVDMVREALAGLRMVNGVPNVPRAPLSRREQRGLLPTMPITRFD